MLLELSKDALGAARVGGLLAPTLKDAPVRARAHQADRLRIQLIHRRYYRLWALEFWNLKCRRWKKVVQVV